MKFADYHLIGEIALGGTSEVYLARDRDGRAVALKVMHSHLADDQELARAFVTEGLVSIRLSHPHIARALAAGRAEDRPFIASEYVDGPCLADLRIACGGRLPLPVAAAVLGDVLGALHYAHNARGEDGRNLCNAHRDLTPHNILVARAGQAKITDFGSVKSDMSGLKTRTGVWKGHFAYMSPEQARGRVVDCRSDVFALGLIAYEILTGAPVYTGNDERAVLEAAMAAQIPALSDPDVPSAVSSAIMRALQASPADRFDNCKTFTDALEAATGRSTVAEVATFVVSFECRQPILPIESEAVDLTRVDTRIVASRRRRQRTRRRLVGATLVCGVLVLGCLWWTSRRGDPVESTAVVSPVLTLTPPGPTNEAVTPSAASVGRVTINTLPWSAIMIDGRLVAETTPLVGYPVAAGRHAVTLRCTNGMTKTFHIDVAANRTTQHFFDFERRAPH